MAVHSINTTAPAFQRALLRSATPVPTPDLTAETVAMLDAIPPLIDDVPHGGANGVVSTVEETPIDEVGVLRTEQTLGVLRDGRETPADVRHRGAPEIGQPDLVPDENEVRPATAADIGLTLANARHMRRALESALDHGTALLAALGLPQLVEDGFVPLDGAAIGDALDLAIDALDALDAPGVDLEDDTPCEDTDPLEDGGDHEPMLGAPERSPYVESLGSPFYEPAAGGVLYRHHGDGQKSWGAGRNDAMNDGEAEPGYDLPEGDDERDGGSSGEIDNDGEPMLGAPENHDVHPDQGHWSQGEAGERGEDEPDHVQFLPFEAREANVIAAREARARAEAIRRRLRPAPAQRDEPVLMRVDGGNLVPVPGVFWWEGPAHV